MQKQKLILIVLTGSRSSSTLLFSILRIVCDVVNYDKVKGWNFLTDQISTVYNQDSQNFAKEFAASFAEDNMSIQALADKYKRVDENVVKLAQDVTNGKISLDQFNKTIADGSSRSASLASGIKNIAKQLGAVAINVGITLAINVLIQAIQALVDHEHDLASIAKEATVELNRQREAIDAYAKEAGSLYEVLNKQTSSQEELISSKRRLAEIQRELIEQYGNEAASINLTTASIQEQKEAIRQLNELKYSGKIRQDFENNINQNDKWQNFVEGFMSIATNGLSDIGGFSYQNTFGSNLDKNRKRYEQFSQSIRATTDKTIKQILDAYDNVSVKGNRITFAGNVEDVQETISDIQSRLKSYPGYTDQFNNALTRVYNNAKEISTELNDFYSEDMKYRIFSDDTARSFYDQLEDAYNDYLSDTNNQAAYQAYIDVVKQIQNSDDLSNAIKQGIIDGFDSSVVSGIRFDSLVKNADIDDVAHKLYSLRILKEWSKVSGATVQQELAELNTWFDEIGHQYETLSDESLAFLADVQRGVVSLDAVAEDSSVQMRTILEELASFFNLPGVDQLLELINQKYYNRNGLTLGHGYSGEVIRDIANRSTQNQSGYSFVVQQLNAATKDLSDVETRVWADAAKGALNYHEAIKLGANAVEEWRNRQKRLTTDFNFDQVMELDKFQNIRQELIGMAQRGELDEDALRSYKDFDQILEEIGETADISDEKIKAMIDSINSMAIDNSVDNLNDYRDKLSKLEDAYTSFAKNERIDTSQLSALQDVFGDDSKAFSDFRTAVMSGEKDLQQYFDAMATELAYSVYALDNLTEAEKEYVIQDLAAMGVSNAREVVEAQLAHSEQIRAEQLNAMRAAYNALGKEEQSDLEITENLENMTYEEAAALFNEAEQAGYTSQALAALVVQKFNAENTDLTNTDDYEYLIHIAKLAGVAAEALQDFQKIKEKIANLEDERKSLLSQIGATSSASDRKNLQQQVANLNTDIDLMVNSLNKKIEDSIQNTFEFKPTFEYDGGDDVKKSLADAKDSTEKEFDELFDFFERRVEVLSQSIELLGKELENVVGSAAKNQLLDAQRGIYQEEIRNYEDAAQMYQEMADTYYAKVPDEFKDKIKDGAVAIEEFMGEASEETLDAIKSYQEWANKVNDCTQQLAELKETLRQLELSKFNNIVQDFTEQFDLLQSHGIDMIQKQMDLFSESGEVLGVGFYKTQQDITNKQIALLEKEKQALVTQLNSAIANGVNRCPRCRNTT